MTEFRELAVAFMEAIAKGDKVEARRLGELMFDKYPEQTNMFHLFIDTENALRGNVA